jgi:hypothetical protein
LWDPQIPYAVSKNVKPQRHGGQFVVPKRFWQKIDRHVFKRVRIKVASCFM